MTETKEKTTPKRKRDSGDSQIIGFRLSVATAKAIKVEAARRQMLLNTLLTEMWQLYRDNKRAS